MARIKLSQELTQEMLESRGRYGRRPADVARASVQIFIVAGVNAIDSFAARRTTDAEVAGVLDDEGRSRVGTAVTTIHASIEQTYAFLRDFSNYPLFMNHLDSVVPQGDGRSRWRLRMPGGRIVEWDAELIDERPGELLAWRSVTGAAIDSRGSIRLLPAPGGRGTEVHLDIRYSAPARGFAVLLATVLGMAPGQRAKGDLRRLKQLLETGEIVHSDASIHRLMHAAQPPTDEFVQRHVTGEAA